MPRLEGGGRLGFPGARPPRRRFLERDLRRAMDDDGIGTYTLRGLTIGRDYDRGNRGDVRAPQPVAECTLAAAEYNPAGGGLDIGAGVPWSYARPWALHRSCQL